MPIDTPDKALTLAELPTVTPGDTAVQAIVTTNMGAKKLPLGSLFEPYNLLIGTYQYYAGSGFPHAFSVPMLGGLLDPDDFEDKLKTLKSRVPIDWITSDGDVKLPLVLDHVLQQDLRLEPGVFQKDAMQNITGNIFAQTNGVGGYADGVFSYSYGGHGNLTGALNDGHQAHFNFDLSRVARTNTNTRENTLNAVLCILTGQNTSTMTKRYYIIDPLHGEYIGWYVDLAVGKHGQAIGFNSAVMTDIEPIEFSQASLAEKWNNETPSDPLGLSIQVKTRKMWNWTDFDQTYRTFRIGGRDVFITADITGIRMLGGNGTDSIVFSGAPSYNGAAAWGSGYGVTYHATSVIINGSDFTAFTITGLPTVTVWFRVKGSHAILSMIANGRELDSQWWNNLESRCPSERKQNLQVWLARMPHGMYNAANTNDTFDSIPQSRFYLYSSKYNAKTPSQNQLWTNFQSASVTDDLGLYTAAQQTGFSLVNFASKEQRTFLISGFSLSLEATNEGIKWTSEDGYYVRAACTVSVGNTTTYHGQNQQVIFQATDSNWFFGGPDIAEINTTRGYAIKMLLCVKSSTVLFSFAGGFNYFSLDKISALISAAPTGRETDMRTIFEHLPMDWENTLNQDTMGENWGTREARFWMQGGINGRS